MSPENSFPTSIDVNPTAKCNLNCSFCWGPEHTIPDGLSTEQWLDAFSFFKNQGTENIVFTGGEPLLRRDIGELMSGAKELTLQTTLSTNSLLLEKKADEVLPHTDQIGFTVDGSTAERHAQMRRGRQGQRSFYTTFSSAHLVTDDYPHIHRTVRTVLSKVNKDDIINIGNLLEENKQLFDRWKIYQFTPVSIGARHKEEHSVSDEEFYEITSSVQSRFDLPIEAYPANQRPRKYIFIYPGGTILGVDDSGKYKSVGHLLIDSPTAITQKMQTIFEPRLNEKHAH